MPFSMLRLSIVELVAVCPRQRFVLRKNLPCRATFTNTAFSPPLDNDIDKTEGLSRLYKPGSLNYALRPPGWGKTTMLHDLANLLRGGARAKECFSEATWIRRNRSLLFRQPAMLPLVLSLSANALQSEPVGKQLQRQLVDILDGKETNKAEDSARESVMHTIELISDLCTKSQAGSADDGAAYELTAALMVECIEKSSRQLHRNRRIAVLVDDFDAPFLSGRSPLNDGKTHGEMQPFFPAGILRGCADSVIHMRGGAAMFMFGTFRISPSGTNQSLLDTHFVDLSLDMLHNNTWGLLSRDISIMGGPCTPWIDSVGVMKQMSAANLTPIETKAKRFRWDDRLMKPVKVEVDALVASAASPDNAYEEELGKAAKEHSAAPLSYSGGYWFGGYDEETGNPEAVFPFRPWGPCVDANTCLRLLDPTECWENDHILSGLESLASGVFCMNPMQRFHNRVSRCAPSAGVNDWSVVLHQAGILTLAARSVRFDEFHSYAWARLGFPNEAARAIFVERIVRQVVEAAFEHMKEKEPDLQTSTSMYDKPWQELRSAQLALSKELLAKSAEKTDEVTRLVGRIKSFSSVVVKLLSAGKNTEKYDAIIFKLFMLCVPHLDVHDRQGDDVTDTGLSQDTFSGSRGTGIMDDLAPKPRGIELAARLRHGAVALPEFAMELNRPIPPEGTLHVLDSSMDIQAVIKFTENE